MRAGLFRVALLSVSILMTAALGECVIRVALPQPVSWLAIYRSHPDLPFFSMLPNKTVHVDTGEMEWTVSTDDRGFRFLGGEGPAVSGCSVLWLGDSFTFGHGVEYADSYVGLVEARTPGVRHINSAVAGYGPVQYRAVLESLGAKGTDFEWIVVGTFVGNDFHDTQWDKDPVVEDGILGNDAGLKSLLKRNLHLYRLLTATYHGLVGGSQNAHDTVSTELARPAAWREDFLVKASDRYASEMRAIFEYAGEHDKQVLFMILPTREAASDYFGRLGGRAEARDGAEERADPMLPVRRALAIFEEIGAPVLDLTPIVGERPPEEMYLHFDGHLTPKANERVAEALVGEIDMRCGASDEAG